MKKSTLVLIVIIVLSLVVIGVYKLLSPYLNESRASRTSDAKDMKATIRITLDSWIGYYFLESPVFKKLMRDSKYLVKITDDKADYSARMEKLRLGEIDFAVATVDSYLLNAADKGFPATIVAVIDESKGGDALVAWESKIKNIEDLKNRSGYKIAFTPGSPSEYLLKTIGVHFNITPLLDKQGIWRVETNGAEEAYQKLFSSKVDAAVLWEPHVTAALMNPGIVKLLGSEDTEKLIVDILLVNRNFAQKNQELVGVLLANYFQTLDLYSNDKNKLKEDIAKDTKSTLESIEAMLKGVQWLNLAENARWFELGSATSYQGLIEAIDSTAEILIENGDFSENPLPNKSGATIINSSFIKNLYFNQNGGAAAAVYEDSLRKAFPPLTEEQWDKLKQIGTLKVRPITFQSSTAELSTQGELQIDKIIENIKHYPNFRILVKGHTGITGDSAQNLLLSQARAQAVANYIITKYGVNKSRLRAVGVGGNEPLKREDGESSRAYNDRLKRVEILLVNEEF